MTDVIIAYHQVSAGTAGPPVVPNGSTFFPADGLDACSEGLFFIREIRSDFSGETMAGPIFWRP